MKAQFQLPPDEPVDPMTFDPVLTPFERSRAAMIRCQIEDRRRRQNEADAERLRLSTAAEEARLGIVWEGGE